MRIHPWTASAAAFLVVGSAPALAQQSCKIPREARDIWRCENGFVIGPEDVIIRLPIPETDPEALYNAGLEAAQREDWRVAIAYFTAAHQRAHLVPKYMYNLGLAHARAGNEVAAVAWLITYLIADPDVANRQTIWAEIARLEAAIHRRSTLLFDQAEEAAGSLPRAAQGQNDQNGARADGYFAVASAAARIGDFGRAQRIADLGEEARLRAVDRVNRYFPDEAAIRSAARSGALLDSDLVSASALTAELGAPPTGYGEAAALAALERGGVNSSLCGSFLMERFQTFVCPDFQDYVPQNYRDYEQALRTGNRNLILSARGAIVSDDSHDPITLALRGQASRAASGIAGRDDGFESNEREGGSAAVAEALMRTNSRGAEQFVANAESFVSHWRAADGATVDMWWSGWFAARARAFLLAEQDQIQEAVDLLDAYTSRRLASWPRYGTPRSSWMQARFDGLVTVAQYLVDRGRAQEATDLIGRLDSMRRARASATYPAVFGSDTRQNDPMAGVQHAQLTEQAVILATTLPGVCYDLEWEIDAIATGRGEQGAEYGPSRRVTRLSDAGAGLQHGLRRMRAIYERSGQTWGR